VQAQLRAQLVAQLGGAAGPKPDLIPAFRPGGSDQAACAAGAAATPAQPLLQHGDPAAPRLWRAAMDSLVADHLAACGLGCALSVFAAEAGLPDAGAPLARADLLALLRLPERHPAAADAMAQQPPGAGSGAGLRGGRGR
jgi:hypothetical protein